MLSKSQIKLINSLTQKKYRQKHQLFFAEGVKVIKELLNSSFELEMLFTEVDLFYTPKNKIQLLKPGELQKISKLSTPQTALALFKIPENSETLKKGLIVALDGVRDPGNLGTIIRLCDWFGVENIICSKDTVDCYNPKVIQATMGSIARVRVSYTNLEESLPNLGLPLYGTFMQAESVYSAVLPKEAVLILGNEANGISSTIGNIVTNSISIPQFGAHQKTESLNVATATAISLSEFRRR